MGTVDSPQPLTIRTTIPVVESSNPACLPGERFVITLAARSAAFVGSLALLPSLALILPASPQEHTGLARRRLPAITLADAPPLRLTGDVDSNSPVIWEVVKGVPLIHVLTSYGGAPSRSAGASLARMSPARRVAFESHPGHGLWMEAVVADGAGTWYGYYHNEVPAVVCDRFDLAIPRVGAARSADRGRTWSDLGIILEAPPGQHECATPNKYFAGGVGDLSAILDHESKDLYLFFSQYSRVPSAQGVAVARMPWAARDSPVGRVDVWADGAWLPARSGVQRTAAGSRAIWLHAAGTPLVTPSRPWHDAEPDTDAFWGASVHWNTHLEQYVMLLNRAKDETFAQEGIYVSFSPVLDDPGAWSPPRPILTGGLWYPQVIGLERGDGTDKRAGARARLFMSGTSAHVMEFAYVEE